MPGMATSLHSAAKVPPTARQDPLAGVPLTDEQRDIVEDNGRRLNVHAFAGTGKTHTLRAYARARPYESFLYIVFNKANQIEASRSFPPNVRCATSHAIAFAGGMDIYARKLGNPTALTVAGAYRCRTYDARCAIDLVKAYCASGAERLEDTPCPATAVRERLEARRAALEDPARIRRAGQDESEIRQEKRRLERAITRAVHEEDRFFAAAGLAARLWEDMRNPDKVDIPILHDGYLKIYASQGKILRGYDAILFDEAQDANPATLQMLSWQEKPRRIAVGDAYQAIYGFRGSVNALEILDGTPHSLTESFRFGPQAAACANSILSLFGETRKLKGRGAPTEILPRRLFEASTANEQRAFLARSNASAVEAAIEFRGRVHFAGSNGSEDYRVDRILDGWRLAEGRHDEIVDREIKQFRHFREMSEYADEVGDAELIGVTAAVSNYRSDTPFLIEDVKRRETSAANAGLIVSTAHKAKGLEWNNVVLGSFFDFQDFLDDSREAIKNGREMPDEWKAELNLLYVAATRARRRLCPSPEVIEAVKISRNLAKTAKAAKNMDGDADVCENRVDDPQKPTRQAEFQP